MIPKLDAISLKQEQRLIKEIDHAMQDVISSVNAIKYAAESIQATGVRFQHVSCLWTDLTDFVRDQGRRNNEG